MKRDKTAAASKADMFHFLVNKTAFTRRGENVMLAFELQSYVWEAWITIQFCVNENLSIHKSVWVRERVFTRVACLSLLPIWRTLLNQESQNRLPVFFLKVLEEFMDSSFHFKSSFAFHSSVDIDMKMCRQIRSHVHVSTHCIVLRWL